MVCCCEQHNAQKQAGKGVFLALCYTQQHAKATNPIKSSVVADKGKDSQRHNWIIQLDRYKR